VDTTGGTPNVSGFELMRFTFSGVAFVSGYLEITNDHVADLMTLDSITLPAALSTSHTAPVVVIDDRTAICKGAQWAGAAWDTFTINGIGAGETAVLIMSSWAVVP